MAELKATPRNIGIGTLADMLQRGKNYANKYEILPQVPVLGGTGLGDLFMGKTPELINDISYDGLQAAIRGGNKATGGIGTYGAKPAVADALLLGMDITGIGKGLGGLSKKSATALYDRLLEGGTTLSRREALKKLGALAGGTALTGTGVGTLRGLSDNVIADTTKITPKIIDNLAMNTPKTYKYNTLAEYFNHIYNDAADTMLSKFDPPSITSYEGHPDYLSDVTMWDKNFAKEQKSLLKKEEAFYNQTKLDLQNGLEPTPWQLDFVDGKTQATYADEVLSPQAKQELKAWKQSQGSKWTEFDIDKSFTFDDVDVKQLGTQKQSVSYDTDLPF